MTSPEASTSLERLGQLPPCMRALPQWLVWRFVVDAKAKKPRKVPFYVGGGRRVGEQGSEKDRLRLAPFEVACKAMAAGKYDGIGFAFLPGDGLIGIDIDGAIDADTGEVAQRCLDIIAACASYTERSPSGKGVHIIVQGDTQSNKSNAIGLEVFAGSQFFTCTGDHWSGTPADCEPIDAKVLGQLHRVIDDAKAAAADKPKPPARDEAQPLELDDFKRVNAMALALLDAWVPTLFPEAKRSAQGWRVTSKALGREREEDLSLTPQGIQDFGDEQGLTAIDTVLKWRGGKPANAMRWLAGQIGVRVGKPRKPRVADDDRIALGIDAPAAPARGLAGAPEAETPQRLGPPDDDPGGATPAWAQLVYRGDRGGARDCRENVALYLENARDLKGMVAFDEFAHRVVKLKATPWTGDLGEWGQQDDYELGDWLARNVRLHIQAEATLIQGVAMAAWRNRFHPVREYFDALPPWDGTSRLAHWLADWLGARSAKPRYLELVGTWFVMGMVNRILRPGCQMDYMIVLEGPQGRRKSTALRALSVRPEWFADTPIRIGDKDALLSLAGVWLYEVGELDSFNKAEVTAVKQYVSSRVDRVREPFARRFVDRPRSGVFGGSTNQDQYFKDPTGARRMWPVRCEDEIRIELIEAGRDQLFAEALARLRTPGDSEEAREARRYWPTEAETRDYLAEEQEARQITDPWFEKLSAWLDSDVSVGPDGLGVRRIKTFTAVELLTWGCGVPVDRIDSGKQMASRVGTVMHQLGWARKRDSTGARLWRYHRPAAACGGPSAGPPAGSPGPMHAQPLDGAAVPADEVDVDAVNAALGEASEVAHEF